MQKGTLFLVVGPSGAGKDSLISGARDALSGDDRFAFPRRVITRAVSSGGESHTVMSVEGFENVAATGGFALAWSAHGFRYGIADTIAGTLTEGRQVVVNVSRSIIAQAHQTFPNVEVIALDVPPQILRQRLAQRGRETPDQVEGRMGRDQAIVVPEGVVLHTVINDGTLAAGVGAFLKCLGVDKDALPSRRGLSL